MAAKKSTDTIIKNLLNLKTSSILYTLLLISFFFVGYLFAKVQYLQKGAAVPAPVAQQPQTPPAPQGKVDIKNGHLPALGNSDAKVTIVEFADYQCPFCERLFNDAIASIKKDYIDTGKVKLYFRNYAFLGQESTWSAEASECANEQNKFWDYHDYLFNHQGAENSGAFSKDNLKKFAADLGLDTNSFNNCLDTDKYKSLVDQDLKEGQQAGVNGTPATFVNGNMLVGAQPYSAFKQLIDKELASK